MTHCHECGARWASFGELQQKIKQQELEIRHLKRHLKMELEKQPQTETRCFKCEKPIECSAPQWDMPGGAVVFDGGDNFGSTIYDAMQDGIMVRLLICDDCLEKHKNLILERNGS